MLEMTPTIRQAIKNTLDDLSEDDFLNFCHLLRDRREEPRIRLRAVENKSVWDITDLLVSTFTEAKAPQVTVDILRQINCNEEAKTLEQRCSELSKQKVENEVENIKWNKNQMSRQIESNVCIDAITKTCGDVTTFRKTPTGELERGPTQEAKAIQELSKAAKHGGSSSAKTPAKVEAEAKARVLSEGGDPSNKWLVLSRCSIQFGQYEGQTFKWLLENDVGYTAYVVGSHQMEQKPTMHGNLLEANKDSLIRYATTYSEVLKAVSEYKRSQLRRDGEALVGFGAYEFETLWNLYKSNDPEKISYVKFLRTKKSTCTPGSKMEDAIRYILQCDKHHPATTTKTVIFRGKRAQSTRGWRTSASRPMRKKQKRCRQRTRLIHY